MFDQSKIPPKNINSLLVCGPGKVKYIVNIFNA